MNLKLLYKIPTEPIKITQVIPGLWVASEPDVPYTQEEAEIEYFKSSELFQRPLKKCKREKT